MYHNRYCMSIFASKHLLSFILYWHITHLINITKSTAIERHLFTYHSKRCFINVIVFLCFILLFHSCVSVVSPASILFSFFCWDFFETCKSQNADEQHMFVNNSRIIDHIVHYIINDFLSSPWFDLTSGLKSRSKSK